MNENLIDRIGEICWFLMFITPFITVPLVWKFSKQDKTTKILIGIFLAIGISIVLFFISWGIVLRNGLGPA